MFFFAIATVIINNNKVQGIAVNFFLFKNLFIVFFIDALASIKKRQPIRLLLAFSSPFVCDTFC